MVEDGCHLAVVVFHAAAGGRAEVLLQSQNILDKRGHGSVGERVSQGDIDVRHGVGDGVKDGDKQLFVRQHDGRSERLVLRHAEASVGHAQEQLMDVFRLSDARGQAGQGDYGLVRLLRG